MSDPSGFLSRWSRRKREAERTGEPVAERAPDAAATPGLAPMEADSSPAEMSLEDIAALPRIEDLTSDTDLTQFLRAGVPAVLRKAALRRMWSVDPAIRDFVGEARDYSWDWNVEGGVPTFGPLLPTDDVQATLSGMFSRPPGSVEPEESSVATTGPDEPDHPEPEVAESESSVAAEAPAVADATVTEASPALQPELAGVERQAVLLSSYDVPPPTEGQRSVAGPAPEPRRRHGAARPKLD